MEKAKKKKSKKRKAVGSHEASGAAEAQEMRQARLFDALQIKRQKETTELEERPPNHPEPERTVVGVFHGPRVRVKPEIGAPPQLEREPSQRAVPALTKDEEAMLAAMRNRAEVMKKPSKKTPTPKVAKKPAGASIPVVKTKRKLPIPEKHGCINHRGGKIYIRFGARRSFGQSMT